MIMNRVCKNTEEEVDGLFERKYFGIYLQRLKK
jgi:hypothetical protein